MGQATGLPRLWQAGGLPHEGMPMKQMALAIAAIALAMSAGYTQEAKTLDVQIVKYDGLKEIILKNRGKVVLVDVWFTL